jgi:hypothetical protein
MELLILVAAVVVDRITVLLMGKVVHHKYLHLNDGNLQEEGENPSFLL